MKKFPEISVETLEGIARILGDLNRGLTENEIKDFLEESEIPDIMPDAPKWIRIYNAFADIQKNTCYSNNIIAFIHKIMKPARYKLRLALFKWRQENLNEKLIFAGLQLTNSGKLKLIKPRKYIEEAKNKTLVFKQILETRNICPEIIDLCKPDLIAENYFLLVFESSRIILDIIREKTGLKEKGIQLIDSAFRFSKNQKPLLAINKLQNSRDFREHAALKSLITGLVGQFREPTENKPVINWKIQEKDALDLLSITSMLIRKLKQTYIYID